jgi:hypothetical protein
MTGCPKTNGRSTSFPPMLLKYLTLAGSLIIFTGFLLLLSLSLVFLQLLGHHVLVRRNKFHHRLDSNFAAVLSESVRAHKIKTIGRSCWFVRLFARTIHLHRMSSWNAQYFWFIFGRSRVQISIQSLAIVLLAEVIRDISHFLQTNARIR